MKDFGCGSSTSSSFLADEMLTTSYADMKEDKYEVLIDQSGFVLTMNSEDIT